MMTRKEFDELLRICPSARAISFDIGNGKKVKAVSVGRRDCDRADVVAILKDQKTLWPVGSCHNGMTMWIQSRPWYPFEVVPMSEADIAPGQRRLDEARSPSRIASIW
jgi:hypothetical protein